MHTTTPTISPTAPAAPNTRRTAAGVKADRRPPAGPGLDTGEDRRTLTKAGTTPTTDPDHRHNADEGARRLTHLRLTDCRLILRIILAVFVWLFVCQGFRNGLASVSGRPRGHDSHSGRPPECCGCVA